jgi:hypothetical protein
MLCSKNGDEEERPIHSTCRDGTIPPGLCPFLFLITPGLYLRRKNNRHHSDERELLFSILQIFLSGKRGLP